MRLKNRTVDDVVIVEVHGDLRGGPDSDTFRELFKDLLEQGHRKFLLNFKGCKWISSPGVGMIVGVFTSIRNRDGQLKIGEYGERIHNLFTTIYLWKVIELYTTEDDALDAFRTGSNAKAFNLRELHGKV